MAWDLPQNLINLAKAFPFYNPPKQSLPKIQDKPFKKMMLRKILSHTRQNPHKA